MSKPDTYKIRIDKQHYEVAEPALTGTELLALAGKQPGRFRIIQRLKGGQAKPIGPTESVCLTPPGVERFMTLPCDQTEG